MSPQVLVLLALAVALVAAVAVVAVVAVVATVRARRRAAQRRRRARPAERTRYPVVLAHGIMGFEALKVGPVRLEYFRGVADSLRPVTPGVHLFRVPPMASVAVRAERLAEKIRALDVPRVNVIAHSMGGLDARWAIARLGLGERIASLVTIATPHHGTPLADTGTALFGDKLGLRRALYALGVEIDGFYDLTTARMAQFNRDVRDDARVAYASCVACVKGGVARMNALLVPTYLFLRQQAGDNDGLVPAASQRWGDVVCELDADHWAQVGWHSGFDARALYVDLARELRSRGL